MKGKLLITLVIIIVLVVNAYFSMGYIKEHKEREALSSQIIEVTQMLREMPQPPQDLEKRLADAQTSLAAEQSALSGEMNSIQIINAILQLADDCKVKAIPLVTQPWSTENVGEHSYRVFRLNLAVEGSFSQLVSFLSKLENGELKTLTVRELSVTGVNEQSDGETVPEGNTPVTASLDLAVYTQPRFSE